MMNDAQVRALIAALMLSRSGDLEHVEEVAYTLLTRAYANEEEQPLTATGVLARQGKLTALPGDHIALPICKRCGGVMAPSHVTTSTLRGWVWVCTCQK